MVHIIIRRSDRMVRERAAEAAPRWAKRDGVTGYARGLEEADRIQRERGRDNPHSGYMLVDDVTAVQDTDKRNRAVIKHNTGKEPEVFYQ